MGIYNFPSNFVYWEKVEDHEDIKKMFLDQIKSIGNNTKDNKQGIVNGSTSYGIEDYSLLNLLKNYEGIANKVVWKPINEAIRQLNSNRSGNPITIKNSLIFDTWFSEYKEGGFFEYHIHNNSYRPIYKNGKLYTPSFSLIYILRDEDQPNTTSFRNPFSMYVSTEDNFESEFDTRYESEIKEGTVLVFPATLYHNVREIQTPNRITVAINVYSCHS
jgi:hypothetical protein